MIQNSETGKAISVTKRIIELHPEYLDAYLFLGNIYENSNDIEAAIDIYEKATKVSNLPAQYKQNIQMRVNVLKQKK